jgi:hypothetical protein
MSALVAVAPSAVTTLAAVWLDTVVPVNSNTVVVTAMAVPAAADWNAPVPVGRVTVVSVDDSAVFQSNLSVPGVKSVMMSPTAETAGLHCLRHIVGSLTRPTSSNLVDR